MKILEYPMKIISKISFFLLRMYIRIRYMPKAVFTDKTVQTNRVNSPCIIIANHTSVIDPLILLTVIKGKKNIVVAKDWYESPKYHRFLRHLPYLPLDRKEWDTAWLDEGLGALAGGKAVLIFPQGRTEKEGTTIPFHPGFALLAQRGGVPVIPVALPAKLRKGRRNIIRVGEPFRVIAKEGERVSRACRAAAAEAEETVRRLADEAAPRKAASDEKS